jgi:hypothetical protein
VCVCLPFSCSSFETRLRAVHTDNDDVHEQTMSHLANACFRPNDRKCSSMSTTGRSVATSLSLSRNTKDKVNQVTNVQTLVLRVLLDDDADAADARSTIYGAKFAELRNSSMESLSRTKSRLFAVRVRRANKEDVGPNQRVRKVFPVCSSKALFRNSTCSSNQSSSNHHHHHHNHHDLQQRQHCIGSSPSSCV